MYASETNDSVLKLADFGLSKMLAPEVVMQTVCGTPGYCGTGNILFNVFNYNPGQNSRGHSARFGIIKNFNRNQNYTASRPPPVNVGDC